MPSLDEYISRCACAGNHFFSMKLLDGDESEAYLSVCGDFRPPHGLLSRLRVAAQALRKGHADTQVELILDKKQAGELAKVLSDWAASGEKEAGA